MLLDGLADVRATNPVALRCRCTFEWGLGQPPLPMACHSTKGKRQNRGTYPFGVVGV